MRIKHRVQEKSPLLASGLIFSRQYSASSAPTTLEYSAWYDDVPPSQLDLQPNSPTSELDLQPNAPTSAFHDNVLTPVDIVEALPPVVSLRESTESEPGIHRILEAMRLLLDVSRALAYLHEMDVHHSNLTTAVYVANKDEGSVYKLKPEAVVDTPTDDVLKLGFLVLERLVGYPVHCEHMDQGCMDQMLDGLEGDLLRMPLRVSGSMSAFACDTSFWTSIPNFVALLRRVLQFDDFGRISAAALAAEAHKVLETYLVQSHVFTNRSLSKAVNALSLSQLRHNQLCAADNITEEFSIVNPDEFDL
ncbi:MAG: uncharacterized protein KVP18_004500 [Porospora cf. gigantea A]|uniref:uncharacterized protein n=1 Tax=Porospora cf. gigantea A TaxID=2853593 RepID=UPI00355963B9|nr:MAG: hypothetical protein KVP18_004500 [Porospora cf. gigantea A]